jgi:hypothetical protein
MPDTTNAGSESNLEYFLKTLWDKRDSGLKLPAIDLFRNITPENIQYLLSLYPFLQIVNTEAMFIGEVTPKFIQAKSGWIIHDYNEAMSSSLGNFLYSACEYRPLPFEKRYKQGSSKKDSSEDKTGGGKAGGDGGDTGTGEGELKPGNGTIVQQAFTTAQEMVDLAHQKNWAGINIVSGAPIMKWAAWVAAESYGMAVVGFEPDKQALLKRQRLRRRGEEVAPDVTPTSQNNLEI